MKNLILFITLFISTISFAQIEISTNQDDPAFTIVEQMPSFPGGQDSMMKFIQKNIMYPQMEKEANIGGTCYVTMVVEKDGTLTGIKILRGVAKGSGLDAEALRVVSMMPNWIPGKQNGRTVRVQYNLPIRFSLK